MGLEDHNMEKSGKVGKGRPQNSINVSMGDQERTLGDINSESTGRGSVDGLGSEGLTSKKGSSGWMIGGAALGGLAVGSLAFGLGFGLSWRDGQTTIINLNDDNAALTAQNQNLTDTNAQLNSSVTSLTNSLQSSLTPDLSLKVVNDISPLLSYYGATFTLDTNSNARLLQTSGGSSLTADNLDNVNSITIPGNTITPYTASGATILNATNTALGNCPSTGSTGAPILAAVVSSLGLVDPATIAANAVNTVTTNTVGTSNAVLSAIQAALPTTYSTDPGYVAGLAAQTKTESTQASVVAAIVNAVGPNAISSIIANAVQSVTTSSFATTASCIPAPTSTLTPYTCATCTNGGTINSATTGTCANMSPQVIITSGSFGCALSPGTSTLTAGTLGTCATGATPQWGIVSNAVATVCSDGSSATGGTDPTCNNSGVLYFNVNGCTGSSSFVNPIQGVSGTCTSPLTVKGFGIVGSTPAVKTICSDGSAATGGTAPSCTNLVSGATSALNASCNGCTLGGIYTAPTTAQTCTVAGSVTSGSNSCTNGGTYIGVGSMLPSSVSTAVVGAIGSSSVKALAATALANLQTTNSVSSTITAILTAINNAMASTGSSVVYTWNKLGFSTVPTVVNSTYTSSNGGFSVVGIDAIVPTIVATLGANSVPAMIASAIINSGVINSAGLIASTATAVNVNTGVVSSDPVWILANQDAMGVADTCTSTNNAVLKGLSMSPYSNYVVGTPMDMYKFGKLSSYLKYMTDLSSISITGKTFSYPISLDLSGLNNLNSFTIDNSVVNNQIILPNDLSVLSTTNSTLCYGGGIISNTNGATLSNPGFINATVNNNAVSFNGQTGTGPLCPGNVGSIPSTGFFSTIQSYSNLFNTCQSNLKASNSMVGTLQNATSQAITGANNCLLSNTNLTNYLTNYTGTLKNCINSLQPLIPNQYTASSTVAGNCVGM